MSLIEKHRRKGPNGKAVIDFDPASNKLLTSSKDIELAMRLFKLVDEHRNSYFLLLKREENRDLREWIDLKTPKLNEGDFNYNYCTKSYWILAGLQDFPKCQNPSCSNLLGVHKNCGYLGYSDHCSHRCKTADEKVQQKMISTCRKKHGPSCNWTSSSDEAKQSFIKTCNENFGCDNPMQCEAVKQKAKQSTAKNHNGDPNYRNPEQRLRTCIKTYGQGSNGKAISEARKAFSDEKWDQINSEISATKLANHGDPFYSNSEQMVETRLANNNGVWETEQQKEQRASTCLDRYGVRHNFMIPEFRQKLCHSRRSMYQYDGLNFDSKPELAYYIWLQDNGLSCEYHPLSSFQYEFEGDAHFYQPDFKVGDQLVEIKGNQFFRDKDPTKDMVDPYDHSNDALAEAKHEYMKSLSVMILTEEDYKKYLQYVDDTYGKDYLQQFKRKADTTITADDKVASVNESQGKNKHGTKDEDSSRYEKSCDS